MVKFEVQHKQSVVAITMRNDGVCRYQDDVLVIPVACLERSYNTATIIFVLY